MADPRPREHNVSIEVNGRAFENFVEYQLDTSLIEPSNSFSLSRPFSRDAWDLCRRDAYVRVLIDGQARMSGFIDARKKSGASGLMEISGRDRMGRLVQESAPRSAYGGTTVLAVLEALAVDRHLFQKVTLSNTANRKVLLGKGSKAPADGEAVALFKGGRPSKSQDAIAAMFAKPSKANRIDPGQSRMAVITNIVKKLGLAAWSSADGRELFVGKPNQTQAATFLFRHSGRGQSNVKDLEYEESNADRYSSITAVGAGASSDRDFGTSACSHTGQVLDNPGTADGTGRDFIFPKKLVLAEQAVASIAEADRIALLEQQRRDFARTSITATCWYHGQVITGSSRTLFALDTMARVIDDEIDLDEDFLIYAASFRASREAGETTELHLVPRGTEIVA